MEEIVDFNSIQSQLLKNEHILKKIFWHYKLNIIL